MNQQLHGFYSKKAASEHGYAVWLTPNGEKVKTTYVDSNVDWSDSYKWDDTVYIGPVVECIRSDSKITIS